MTYTINQLQQMSDFEVNKALCIKLGYDVTGISEQRNMMTAAVIDYCNNPNDIMPLAFERKISLIQWCESGSYTAVSDSAVFFGVSNDFSVKDSKYKQYEDMNPLRAIACLLLMMED